jgi:hypothetical protein
VPDPVHEAGETARTALDVFRTQPFLLAMILVNAALLGYLYYQGVNNNQERHRELELLYQNREFVAKLLYQCSPPSANPQSKP